MAARVTAGRSGRTSMWAALGTVYVLWGSTYLGMKYAIESIPPMLSASMRFTVAGLVALVGVRVVRGRGAMRADRTELTTAVVSGLLFLLGGNAMVVIGEQEVDSGVAALIIACVPLWIVLLRTLLRDGPGPGTMAGVLLGLAGVAVLFLPGGSGGTDPFYAGIIVFASLSWAVGALLVARRPVPADPFFLTAVQMIVAGVALAAVAAPRGEYAGFSLGDVTATSWIATGYLVVFGSLVGFTAFVWLLGTAPVSVVSTYAYVNPVVAVLLGVLIAGERLGAVQALGGLVILTAVAVVVTVSGREQRRPEREEVPTAVAGRDPAPEYG